jgi:putative glycosyltransferase
MRFSVVSTMYRSRPYLDEFVRRATEAAGLLTKDFEIVLVNDGSPDGSLEKALEIRALNPHVKVVDLARNFGHHKAMMTGLQHARGERVFLIDSDLEEGPELLTSFTEELERQDADVVHGVQRRRKGGWFERMTGSLFYTLFNAIAPHPIPRNLTTARVMTRRYVDALVQYQEREVNLAAIWSYAGFKQVPLPVDKAHKGTTTYRLGQRVAHLVNSITSFSTAPLVLIFYLGTGISLLAGICATYLVIRRLFFGERLEGWASLIVSIWFLGGVTLLSLGVIGVYLAKIFSEVKQRPYTTVRAVYEARN